MTVRVTKLKDNSYRIRANASEFEALKLLVEIGRKNMSAAHESSLSASSRGFIRRPPFTGPGGPLAVTNDTTTEE